MWLGNNAYNSLNRRPSIAEEDVCYPLRTEGNEIDYKALEHYIKVEEDNQSESDDVSEYNEKDVREKAMAIVDTSASKGLYQFDTNTEVRGTRATLGAGY